MLISVSNFSMIGGDVLAYQIVNFSSQSVESKAKQSTRKLGNGKLVVCVGLQHLLYRVLHHVLLGASSSATHLYCLTSWSKLVVGN